MRQVFTSPRLENVERVAELLREQGIEARITHGRSYRGNRRGNFSYRESDGQPQPAVWVVRSEDQPRARELLRGLGLLDSGRSPTTYLPTSVLDRERGGGDAGRRRAFRIKAGLLIAIALALGLGAFAWRRAAPPVATAPEARAPATAAAPGDATAGATANEAATYVVETPSALAAMLIDAELGAHETALVCLAVDGADPSEKVLSQLQATAGRTLRPRSACAQDPAAADALAIEVREYRTDGSGRGTVRVEIADRGEDGRRRVQARTLDVQRDDLRWRVRRVVL